MKAKILEKLKQIEQKKGLKFFLPVNREVVLGDLLLLTAIMIYDLFIINLDYYWSLWEQTDVIEFMTADDLDGSGWDLRKTVKLLAKSNAPLLE